MGGGVELLVAYAGLAGSGALAWAVGRRIGIEGSALGALLISVILVNTTYLGYPITVALIGRHALPHAVVYDQVVSTPVLFTAGLAIGAAFAARAKAFLTRNPPLAARSQA